MSTAPEPSLVRAVSRWQIVGLSINDVIGSGIYLLPAATAALLGPMSLWAVLLAGLAVGLLVLCYAQAASYFDEPGGSYLYAREAFGRFAGFEIGWMIWLTRISSAAALGNGLADAVVRFWPAAAGGGARLAIVVGSLGLLTAINVIGVKSAARTGVALVIGKLVPLLLFVAIGLFYVDWSWAFSGQAPDPRDFGNMGEAALLLLFAYAGFENIPAAAGEYRNPRRDVPFALITMIVTVTLIYAAVQVVAQGTLANVAQSATPLADAASGFGGEALALILTVGATISILGTTSNTVMLGPRFLFALAQDGYGPAFLARVHPRFRTPAAAILLQGVLSLALALSGSFVQLALLSMVTRLFAYIGTAAAVLVLARRYRDRPGALHLPGGPLIPLAALLLALALLLSASWQNLAAAGVALLVGALFYRFPRKAPA
ncbi:APC family permease [Xanthomonas translucens]|uniref:Arginine/agmatine antiporter n=1 Tax=Xanthomonas translucens pv. translucens DSM 18974 TaxID=1261556 RepID=A0A1C3TJ97_XANCT|nr:APC family permease [Xanthomonas translucens]KTF39999.1 amino acid transporter [Xanthomonas translucens pv. translucens]KWV14115.1 amino acid transporter [Xanthomonas translucens]MCC8446385.1 APC family permease [Xanthomonas translucens pv. translucens]MCS3360959.1 APC family permease [Xanthomonas translucens pv. translucens]MCS3374803.1 APC family permease [Xanthomonas translucens pv. translucens]